MKQIIVMFLCLVFTCQGKLIIFRDVMGGFSDIAGVRCIDEDETLSFTVQSFPVSGTVFLDNKPIGATYINNQFLWTPDWNQSGYYTLYFTSNGDTIKYVVSVSDTNFRIIAGYDFTHMIGASGDDVVITIDNLPQGATLTGECNPMLLRWNPTVEQIGLHTLICRATSYVEGDKFEDVRYLKLRVTRITQEAFKFDFNNDGKVDLLDLAIFAEHWLGN